MRPLALANCCHLRAGRGPERAAPRRASWCGARRRAAVAAAKGLRGAGARCAWGPRRRGPTAHHVMPPLAALGTRLGRGPRRACRARHARPSRAPPPPPPSAGRARGALDALHPQPGERGVRVARQVPRHHPAQQQQQRVHQRLRRRLVLVHERDGQQLRQRHQVRRVQLGRGQALAGHVHARVAQVALGVHVDRVDARPRARRDRPDIVYVPLYRPLRWHAHGRQGRPRLCRLLQARRGRALLV